MKDIFKRKRVDSPCKDCIARTIEPNCHMTCSLYLEYTKQMEEIRAERKMKAIVNSPIKHAKHRPGETAWDALRKGGHA